MKIKQGGGRKSTANPLFPFRHERRASGMVWIMEARKPDRQARLAALLSRSPPRFISYYHVAWLVLHMCVFVLVMWVRPEKMVGAI